MITNQSLCIYAIMQIWVVNTRITTQKKDLPESERYHGIIGTNTTHTDTHSLTHMFSWTRHCELQHAICLFFDW
jgi:hypothetical protein